MNLSEMRDRITILKPKAQSGAVFDLVDKYEDYVTIWSKVEYLKGREFWSAKGVNAETTVKFIVRYRKDILKDMAISFDNTVYNITAMQPLDNTKNWLVIHADEVVESD